MRTASASICRFFMARSTAQAAREFLEAVDALLDVGEAGRVTDAQVFVGAKRQAGNRGDLLFLQQFRAKFARGEPELGDVRKEVKRALGVHAGNARDPIEPVMRITAAGGEFSQPLREMILRAMEG